MEQRTRRAAIYARISQDRSGEQAGVQRQLEDCRALCADRGWTVVGEYVDNNVSAMKRQTRPQYARLLEAVKGDEVDVVVTWATDRLYRRPADLEGLVIALGTVQVATVKSGKVDLSTADGRMIARILGSVSAQESEKRGERVSRAAEQRAKAGRFGGGKRRTGWNATMTELHPVEAPLLAESFAWLNSGRSLRWIAQQWRDRGVPGASGATMTPESLRDAMLRPANAAIATYGRASRNARTEVGPAQWPPIVDESTWRAAAAILTDPARRNLTGPPTRTLLTGIVKCGRCGGPMTGRWKNRGEGRERDYAYVCRRSRHLTRSRRIVDDHVSGRVVDLLTRWHAQGLLDKPTPRQDPLAGREAALLARLDSLAGLTASGDLDPADYATAARLVRAELADVQSRVRARSATANARAILTGEDVAAAFAALDDEQRRSLFRELIESVQVHRAASTGRWDDPGDSIVITWRQ